ncbi:ABC transporter ATP-binding protein [Ornithinibacillus salinisoli]|uniref:ABC transporter ATP-binding protein n=1 Tax=Ornithinibacillus salinisoli TaxID=1848459 RepID=A0ABW4W7C1_9BACI
MIKLQDIVMRFGTTPVTIALNKITLNVDQNDWVTVLGASGSGKTTLLNIIGGILSPSSGIIQIDAVNLNDMEKADIQEYRRNKIGFIYQDFKLFNQYTVLENVMIPQLPYVKRKIIEDNGKSLLENVGLSHRINHFPTELSGGEKQRVAIARALLNNPDILLCDEPTGNLDSKNTEKIMQIIQKLHKTGITVIFVTHDNSLVENGNRILTMQDGMIKEYVGV